MRIKDFQLCYIDENKAYFADVHSDRVWGDDWDDAPYEHNAGKPYAHEKGDLDKPVKIISCMFDGPVETPAEKAGHNSSFSVEDINKWATPWLHPSWGAQMNDYLLAGARVEDFIEYMDKIGGTVYIPLEWIGHTSFLSESV